MSKCEMCDYRKAAARLADAHWLGADDCPYQPCPFGEESMRGTIQEQTDAETLLEKLQYRLARSYQKDRNGREIMRGDRVTGLFHNGRPITGICEFSREHSAWGIRWNRGGIAEFTPFCCTCNVEWEVVG